MSITGDTANHAQTSPEVCALFPTRLEYILGRRFETQSFWSINSLIWIDNTTYNPLHLLAPSQPESQLRSTKPEPIVTCGCTSKLPGMKYSSVSLSLGEAFRKMSWRFSMHPGQPLVSPGCPSTVLHPVVCIEFLSWVLKSWGLEDAVLADSIMELSSLT